MRVLSIIGLLLVACVVSADGYVYRNGYYYYGSEPQAYYRSLVTVPGYYSYGRYYPGYSYYNYYAYNAPAANTYVAPADWKTKVLDIAKARDENKAYLDALKSLGLSVPFQLPIGQGTVPGYAYGLDGQYQQTHLYGANASTVYGRYNDYAALNTNPVVNLDQRLQQYGQLTAGALTIGPTMAKDLGSLIGQASDGQQRVAEIYVKGQVAAQVLRSLDGPPQQTTQQYTFKQTPQQVQPAPQPVPFQAPMMPLASERDQLQKDHFNTKCSSCHNAKKKNGDFDVSTYSFLTIEQKKRVRNYVVTKKCPQLPDGSLGTPLTQAEIDLYD